jgi:GTP pyrophosphokinase
MPIDEAEVARILKYDTPDEFLAALGSGGITETQVATRLMAQQEKPQEEQRASLPISSPTSGVEVLGVGDLLIRIGRCCHPLPGEEIVGFITRTKGVTVHKRSCPNLRNETEQERLVAVDWGQTRQLYPVRLTIQAWDRVGLLRDISTQVSEQGVNIAAVVTDENTDGTATISLTLHTTGIEQLSRVFSKLEGVRGVISATRTATDSPALTSS